MIHAKKAQVGYKVWRRYIRIEELDRNIHQVEIDRNIHQDEEYAYSS